METAHLGFIVASYVLAACVTFGLIAWVIVDFRAQTKRLARLEEQGALRRSGAKLS